MAISRNSRIIDLALGGHPAQEIDAVLSLAPGTAAGIIADLTQTPSGQRNAGVAPQSLTLTPSSGVAAQDATGQDSTVYAGITLHAGGTVTVEIGPTNGVAVKIIDADDATLASTKVFRLPANWWYKITVAGLAAIGTVKQVVSG